MKLNRLSRSIPTFMFTACVLGAVQAPAQTAPAPCALLSAAQVSAAIGATASEGTALGTTCSWSAHHLITTLSVKSGANWQKLKSPSPLPGLTQAPISGLGDDAFSSILTGGTGAAFATVTMLKGTTVYGIKVYSSTLSASQQLAMETVLAGDLLARLAAK
jgi:hypothetical protein